MQHDLTAPEPISPSLALNKEIYRPYLEEQGLTTEQENALLEALWDIMRSFVELGFGVDTIHNIIPALREFTLDEDSQALSSLPASVTEVFADVAGRKGEHV